MEAVAAQKQLLIFKYRFLLCLLLPVLARAQPAPPPTGDAYVDGRGVLRWQNTRREVALFGVNYTAPFAYAYRALGRTGADREQAIAQDVYHLSRLGVDAFRLHVWDVEISDTAGNLLANEHLRLLDFLLAQLETRTIKIILTPIAYWGNGYPEPDEPGGGFSSLYPKGEAYRRPRAIAAQENYLRQFLNHRNPYTGRLLRQDPAIIAFEVCNEPHYQPPLAPVTAFINRLTAAMRATGYRKPIFYNIAESPRVKDAVLAAADVQGLTFQWYPAGLVGGHALRGNLLPFVDQYPLPYRGDARFERRARLVYEFESADVLQPILYPFMARSLRTAGFQWATQFAYDPLALAAFNTEYPTHYLNLAYTPAKALSLLIASRVFHAVPRGRDYGRYPADSMFGAARVSYRQQRSEWNAPAEFYYTASTASRPVRPAALRHVAGVGSSALVRYEGSGVYFLDQLGPGAWRLEVLPDAVPVRDPFGPNSLRRAVTRIEWQAHALTLALPDLGPDYQLQGLNQGNEARQQARAGQLAGGVRPGAYLLRRALSRAGRDARAWTAQTLVAGRRLGEFVAPPPSAGPPEVRHEPVAQATAGQPLAIAALVAGLGPADSAWLVARHYYGPARRLPLRRGLANQLTTSVPAALTYPGLLRYWVEVRAGGQTRSFPGGQPGAPLAWDFDPTLAYEVPLVAPGAPLPLFAAGPDRDATEARGLQPGAWTDYPTAADGQLTLRFSVSPPGPGEPAPAPTAAPAAALRAYLGPKTAGRRADLAGFTELLIDFQTNQPAATRLRVALVSRDGVAYAADVPLPAAPGAPARVPLSALRPAPLLLSPRPYPGFLPLYYSAASPAPFQFAEIDVLQLVLDQPPVGLREPLRVDVVSVLLR